MQLRSRSKQARRRSNRVARSVQARSSPTTSRRRHVAHNNDSQFSSSSINQEVIDNLPQPGVNTEPPTTLCRNASLSIEFLLNPTDEYFETGDVVTSLHMDTAVPTETGDLGADYEFGFPENDSLPDNETPVMGRSHPGFECAEPDSQRVRTGKTTKWIGGYRYTEQDKTNEKVYYRCSHYRSGKCKGRCEFLLHFEMYTKFVPHTCGRSALPQSADPNMRNRDVDVTEAMQKEVDRLAISTSANRNEIWDTIRTQFYGNADTNLSTNGLTMEEVKRRVNRTRAEEFGGSVYGQIEVSPWSQVLNDDGTPSTVNFLLFHYFYFDKKSKTRQRLIGWAHPVLLNLLKHNKSDVFVDGTFRSVPPKSKQCIIFTTYDRPTRSFYPAAFVLCTSKKYDTYFHAMRLILDETEYAMDPEYMYCDFEAGMIREIKDHFPNITAVGCLFHFKQACRRKMRKYGIPESECNIAMQSGVLDMLTVIPQDKVRRPGMKWVKAKIGAECALRNITISQMKWSRFWKYFTSTWITKFPPQLWNVEPISASVISRTNNPLERFNREMNGAFPKPHPNLIDFVVGLEKLTRRYFHLKQDIEIKRAVAPVRLPIPLPKPVLLNRLDFSSDSEIEQDSEDSSEEESDLVLRADPRLNFARRREGGGLALPNSLGEVQQTTSYYEDLI